MIYIRSALFKVAFYGFSFVMSVVCMPGFLLLPERQVTNLVRVWGWCSLQILKFVAGTRIEIRGRENIPSGPALIAAKHQSMMETLALLPLLGYPTYVMKAELKRVPFFGLYTVTSGMIHIEREKGPSALRSLVGRARTELEKGRQIVIFPEGTRRPPGAPPEYQTGVALLYKALNLPVIPVAVNTGLYWARQSFFQYPGTAVIEFLSPIPAGIETREFLGRLESVIETASDRLLLDAARAGEKPPLPGEARSPVGNLTAD